MATKKKNNEEVKQEEVIEEEDLENSSEEVEEIEELPPLKIGQKVPHLEGLNWIKGEPIDIGKKITIVEFWATWCGPCLDSIPHLTSLQEKYKDKLNIIGISREEEETVVPFVKEMGKKMDYRVAIAPEPLYNQYMAGIDGIPTAFLIGSDGKLLWKCHPLELDGVLEPILNGTLKPSELLKLSTKKQKYEENVSAIYGEDVNEKKLLKLVEQNVKLAKEILSSAPGQIEVFRQTISLLSTLGKKELIDSLCSSIDASKLLALELVTLSVYYSMELPFTNRPYQYIIQWIEKAVGLEPQNPIVLDAYSQVLYNMGMMDKAIEVQKKAVDLATEEYGYIKENYETFLLIQKLQKQIKK